MWPALCALLVCVRTLFRSRLSLQVEVLALRHQLASISDPSSGRAFVQQTESSGLGSRGAGQGGARFLSSRAARSRLGSRVNMALPAVVTCAGVVILAPLSPAPTAQPANRLTLSRRTMERGESIGESLDVELSCDYNP